MISDILGKSVTVKCSLLVLTNKIESSHKMPFFSKFNGMSSTFSSLYQPKSAKMARNILLTSPNFISSCRNYDEVLSLAFSNNFLVGAILFWRFITIDVKKLLKFSAISVGSAILSAIIVDTLLSFLVF